MFTLLAAHEKESGKRQLPRHITKCSTQCSRKSSHIWMLHSKLSQKVDVTSFKLWPLTLQAYRSER